MTQYLVTYEKDNPTWATLDAGNLAHYASRATPDWLVEARAVTDRTQKALDEFHEIYGASTDWTPEQAAEFETLLNARNAALEWERDCIEINSNGEVPASIQYYVQMREDAR